MAPMLEAKCPGFFESASMINSRSSTQTLGSSSTGSFLRSAGLLIFDSNGYDSLFFSTLIFFIDWNKNNDTGGNDGENYHKVDFSRRQ